MRGRCTISLSPEFCKIASKLIAAVVKPHRRLPGKTVRRIPGICAVSMPYPLWGNSDRCEICERRAKPPGEAGEGEPHTYHLISTPVCEP